MATTTNKAFRYPTGDAPASDVDIANLWADFDIEVNNQLTGPREQLRHRAQCSASLSSWAPTATGNVPLNTGYQDALGMFDPATGRITVNAAAGAGIYVAILSGSPSAPTTNTGVELGIQKNSGIVQTRQKRPRNIFGIQTSALVFAAVGDYFYGVGWWGGTGNPTWSQMRLTMVKLGSS